MATEQLAETVAEELDDVAVGVEKVADATRRLTGEKVGFFFSGVGVGVIAGFAAGYFIANHRLKTKYSKLAAGEISRIREHYYAKEKARHQKPPLNEVRVEHEETVVVERPTRPSVPVVEPKRSNVFQQNDNDVWDYDEEAKKRMDPTIPYIIHVDEFRENTPEHDQYTYTYYEVDDVLANERDMTIDDLDETIGLENLDHKWGHGSKDSNIIYVRNERLRLDFEIIRDRGSFAEQTSGTIRHSAHTERIRPRRRFDDE